MSNSSAFKRPPKKRKKVKKAKSFVLLDYAQLEAEHMQTVHFFMKKKFPLGRGPGLPTREDIKQQMMIQIIKAMHKFDPERYLTTSSYNEELIKDPKTKQMRPNKFYNPAKGAEQIAMKQVCPEASLKQGRIQYGFGALTNWCRRFLSENHPDKLGGMEVNLTDIMANTDLGQLANPEDSYIETESSVSMQMSSSEDSLSFYSEEAREELEFLLAAAEKQDSMAIKRLFAAMDEETKAAVGAMIHIVCRQADQRKYLGANGEAKFDKYQKLVVEQKEEETPQSSSGFEESDDET